MRDHMLESHCATGSSRAFFVEVSTSDDCIFRLCDVPWGDVAVFVVECVRYLDINGVEVVLGIRVMMLWSYMAVRAPSLWGCRA